MEARTVGAICLGPSGNANERYRWYSLYSRRVLHWSQFAVLLMPIDAINWVEYMAKKLGHTQELTFCDSNMNVIEDGINIVN